MTTQTKYDRPLKYVGYGTAGFRDQAKYLDVIVHRVGLVAAARSRFLKGQVIGVMITASHNPPADNGAKLIDPYGDMLDPKWEPITTDICNAQSSAECDDLVAKLYKDYQIDSSVQAKIVIGRDTRESGPRLTQCLTDALQSNVDFKDFGLVTTPQLHYIVRAFNTAGGPNHNDAHLPEYGKPEVEGYYVKLSTAIKQVLTSPAQIKITVDCANGVGALQLEKFIPYLQSFIDITLVNTNYKDTNTLNVNCGADFVKTNQKLPDGITPQENQLYASFDGDADRVVFYYVDQNQFHLLDGDRIATLAAKFAQQQTSEIGNVDIGVVQTAYANGSSTNYITDKLQLPVVCTPTGVKNLHHVAQKFDIGIYFEANGHGTVLFKPSFVESLEANESASAKSIKVLNDLVNQTVGDAISDMLMVLVILKLSNADARAWGSAYNDLPNRLLKTEVRDRQLFRTTDAERQLVEPEGLQSEINALVSKYSMARSFVRASGTEDVVRVYAEAETQTEADKLAQDVKQAIDAKYAPTK